MIIPAQQFLLFFQNKTTRRNFITLAKFFILLVFLVAVYSVLFHVIMLYEGRNHSWITGVYWSLTVMSTLGFGDITFQTDLGLLFTMFVLVSGVIFMLVILPWLDTSKVRSTKYRPVYRWFFWLFVFDVLVLGYMGSQPAEGINVLIAQLATLYYFLHFLVVLPLLGKFERPKPLPRSISEAVLPRGGGSAGMTPAAARPMDKA